MRLSRFIPRIFIFFSIFYLLSSIFIVPAHAQYSNPYITPNTDSNVPANLHTYTQSIVLEVLSAFTCQIIGQDPLTQNHMCLGLDTTTGKLGYVDSHGGAIGFTQNMIAALYTPPVNTVGYLHYVASNFGLAKHAYAASAPKGSSVSGCSGNGCGFDQLTPLLGLWTTARNIAYAVFVLIFIAIGFAIMLRVQIDPRTVMTIENQIPKIIIALILVTFSYAISGFLIDLMYASTYLTINVIASSQGASSNATKSIHNAEQKDLTGGNPFGFANDIISPGSDKNPGGILGIAMGSAGGVKDIINNLFTGDLNQTSKDNSNVGGGAVAGGATGAVAGAVIGSFFAPGVGTLIGAGIGAALGAITGAGISLTGANVAQVVTNAVGTFIGLAAGLLAFLIIAIAILIALVRLWFSLLMAYVGILLDIILAPFLIIAGVFPGSKIGFSMWLRDIGSNLLAFPVTVALFLLTGVFMNNFATSSSNMFVPPLIGNVNGNITGQSPIAYLIALGMILLTPNIVTMVREAIGAPKNQYTQVILGNALAGAGPIGTGVKAVVGYNQKDLLGKSMRWRGVLQVLGL